MDKNDDEYTYRNKLFQAHLWGMSGGLHKDLGLPFLFTHFQENVHMPSIHTCPAIVQMVLLRCGEGHFSLASHPNYFSIQYKEIAWSFSV